MRTYISVILALCCISFPPANAATLQPGSPAPPLQLTQLLQAPPGTHADWKALRGKVVVLEFWATWCGPCIANIPHLNELASSLDPAKVQFISVDDEDPKLVQNFLAKRKMAGWIGLDTTGDVFKRYGVGARPTTVIVDKHGGIVAVTRPEDIAAKDLLAVVAGKEVSFKAAYIPIPTSILKSLKTQPSMDALFEVSLSKAAPNTQTSMVHWSDGKLLYAGAKADFLLTYAFNLPADRLVLNTPLPQAHYDLRVISAGVEDSAIRPILQTAIASGLHLRVETKNVTKMAYVLRATAHSPDLLTPAVTQAEMNGYWQGKVRMVGGSMDNLASDLEAALHQPVLNETGIAGAYDAELAVPTGNAGAAKAAVAKMGLELVEEERPVPMLEVSAMPGTPSDAATKASVTHN